MCMLRDRSGIEEKDSIADEQQVYLAEWESSWWNQSSCTAWMEDGRRDAMGSKVQS